MSTRPDLSLTPSCAEQLATGPLKPGPDCSPTRQCRCAVDVSARVAVRGSSTTNASNSPPLQLMSTCRSPPLKLPTGAHTRPLPVPAPPRVAFQVSEPLVQLRPVGSDGIVTDSVPDALLPFSEPLTATPPPLELKRPLRIGIREIVEVVLACLPLLQRSRTDMVNFVTAVFDAVKRAPPPLALEPV